MKYTPTTPAPSDAAQRRAARAVICYPTDTLPKRPAALYQTARETMVKTSEAIAPPREAVCFNVPAGQFFRIVSVGGPQVGDLNLFNAHNFDERFYSGKTRALHGTHLSTGDCLWSSFPHLRPLATITYDTLDWYGWDKDGANIHDVIGTRCDPYTNLLLGGGD